MPWASQGVFSTNWKSGLDGSKCSTSSAETPKVISVVHSAIQRALPCAAQSSPRLSQISSAPATGRNVTTDRMGQVISVAPRAEHEPGDQTCDADQHRKRVVIERAALQPHDIAGDVEHARRDAVRTEAVDDGAVALLPEEGAEPLRRTDEDDVVELVEVPLVQKEAVQHLVLVREFDRQVRPADVEQP